MDWLIRALVDSYVAYFQAVRFNLPSIQLENN